MTTQLNCNSRGFTAILAGVLFIPFFTGCATQDADRSVRMERGYVYYLDGAGGGGMISNYGGGLKKGMLDAGYDGAGEIFGWNTGLGVVADQTCSAEYKQGKAKKLAQEIVKYQQSHPSAPVTLMGLSAGTAVVAFTLESLPPDSMVYTVVMLSGSLSSNHDLTAALGHVRGKMYVFTSERDAVLTMLVPFAGTADRESAAQGTIGTVGPRIPRGASAETRQLYSKIVKIPWTPEFERYGDFGGHTDTVKSEFVQAFVAPLVIKGGGIRPARTVLASSSPRVANPDYQRWAKFPVGSWVEIEGYQLLGGKQRPLHMRATLQSKADDHLIVHRDFTGPSAEDALASEFRVAAEIDAREHPLTHPNSKISDLESGTITVGGKNLTYQVRTIAARDEFPAWGHDVEAQIWSCPNVPGGMAQIELTTTMKGVPTKFFGKLVEYDVPLQQGAE
jgi:hypothetical protein